MTTKAKICGITTREALDAAVEGGADYVGFVFFAKSPRNIGIRDAAALAEHVRGKAKAVALVVDADDEALRQIVDGMAPDFLQLHGRETPERTEAIKARFGVPVIKAIGVETAEDADLARTYRGVADIILFDAKAPKNAVLPGGNGLAFDWRILDNIRNELPFMLSGGLTAETVADAIRLTGAQAVDVSSGVERSPGVKDVALIRRFLQAVKPAKQI